MTPDLTPIAFARKWAGHSLSERSACQQHFLDICSLVGQVPPAGVDKTGEEFTFEKGIPKYGGTRGWADVWKRGHFAWEYKRPGSNLESAYKQLLLYRESLENPPLLIVSDTQRLIIRTNFTGTLTESHEVDLTSGDSVTEGLTLLRAVFFEPEALRPGTTSAKVTADAASTIAGIAVRLREKGHEPQRVAHFLDRVVFCMFAEDIDLLPSGLFTNLLERRRRDPEKCHANLEALFQAMADGGDFGVEEIRHFNGGLFEDAEALPLDADDLDALYLAAQRDWKEIDPTIFGTLFERGLDPAKRAQLGAHYTSKDDIELLLEPVMMRPLQQEWGAVQAAVAKTLKGIENLQKGQKKRLDKAALIVRSFLGDLASKKVLDPACGSGNFLYTSLQKLKDLEKEVIVWAESHGLGTMLPQVHPRQLYGIETNVYAFELAQLSVWIGYLQWIHRNGFGSPDSPVLQPLGGNFRNADAILALNELGVPHEAEWPTADYVIGNPPFVGGKLLRRSLGDDYVSALFIAFEGRVKRESDLCCYWFEVGRRMVAAHPGTRVGLLATQGIRGKANRQVLERIAETGGIFFAESDRDWVLDGAAVHVSIIGFDDGSEKHKMLDGAAVETIPADLRTGPSSRNSEKRKENRGIAFMGATPAGPYYVSREVARELLNSPNPHKSPNSDVLRPCFNGKDINDRPSNQWILDFGDLGFSDAARYEKPFKIAEDVVLPARKTNKRQKCREFWWRFERPRPAMREAIAGLTRCLATSGISKHRLFSWIPAIALPTNAVFVFARDDDYFMGVLSSRFHLAWARLHGTQLRESESGSRYTPTTCFETFPFPDATPDAEAQVAEAARELDTLRREWLNPASLSREHTLMVSAGDSGPWRDWGRLLGIEEGDVPYVTRVAANESAARELKKRTLTALYNDPPAWLRDAHDRLDHAVTAAYGMSPGISDSEAINDLITR